MIEVQVSVLEDISPENKKKTVEGMTKVFEGLGVPKEVVESSFMKRQRARTKAPDFSLRFIPWHPIRDNPIVRFIVFINKHFYV